MTSSIEELTDQLDLLGQDPVGLLPRRRLGRDPHLQSLHAAGQEGDGGVARGVELVDAIVEQFGQTRLAVAPGAQGAAADDRLHAGSTLEVRENGALDHLLHLVGHARHGVDDLTGLRIADGTDETGRGAGLLGHGRGTFGHLGLTQVVVGHVATPRAEHGPDPVGDLGVGAQLDAHHSGDHVAGDVVVRRPEAAAHDDGVAAVEGDAQGRGDAIGVVAHLRLEVRVDAHERELLADPG